VKKRAARRLHELQDPSSPVKPFKLCRTESNLEPPPINLGESVLAVPVDLHGMSFICDLELDAIILEKIDVNEELATHDSNGKAPKDQAEPDARDSNGKAPKDQDEPDARDSKDLERKQPADNDTQDEAGPSGSSDSTTDCNQTNDNTPLDPRNCPLLLSSRPKSKKDKSGDISFLLATPVA
jgi:hypothetical protein